MDDSLTQGLWRMDWGLGNPNKTSALIATLMVAVWLFAYIRKWGFWVALTLFTGLGICLVLTQSRGGLIGLILGCLWVLSSGGKTYQWSYIGYTKLDYHLILQRYAGHAQVAQFNWGFQWDNYNDTWPSPSAPFGYGYTSYGGVSGTTGPAGEFYGMYGITGL